MRFVKSLSFILLIIMLASVLYGFSRCNGVVVPSDGDPIPTGIPGTNYWTAPQMIYTVSLDKDIEEFSKGNKADDESPKLLNINVVFDASGSMKGFFTEEFVVSDGNGLKYNDDGTTVNQRLQTPCRTYRALMEKLGDYLFKDNFNLHMYTSAGKVRVRVMNEGENVKDSRYEDVYVDNQEIDILGDGNATSSEVRAAFVREATSYLNFQSITSNPKDIIRDVVSKKPDGSSNDVTPPKDGITIVLTDMIFIEKAWNSNEQVDTSFGYMKDFLKDKENGVALIGIQADFLFGKGVKCIETVPREDGTLRVYYKGVEDITYVSGQAISNEMTYTSTTQPFKHPLYMMVFGKADVVNLFTNDFVKSIRNITSDPEDVKCSMLAAVPKKTDTVIEGVSLSDGMRHFARKENMESDTSALVNTNPGLVFYTESKVSNDILDAANDRDRCIDRLSNTLIKHWNTWKDTDPAGKFISERIARNSYSIAMDAVEILKEDCKTILKANVNLKGYDENVVGCLNDVGTTVKVECVYSHKVGTLQPNERVSFELENPKFTFDAKNQTGTLECDIPAKTEELINRIADTSLDATNHAMLFKVTVQPRFSISEKDAERYLFVDNVGWLDEWSMDMSVYNENRTDFGRFINKTMNLRLFREKLIEDYCHTIVNVMSEDARPATTYFLLDYFTDVGQARHASINEGNNTDYIDEKNGFYFTVKEIDQMVESYTK